MNSRERHYSDKHDSWSNYLTHLNCRVRERTSTRKDGGRDVHIILSSAELELEQPDTQRSWPS